LTDLINSTNNAVLHTHTHIHSHMYVHAIMNYTKICDHSRSIREESRIQWSEHASVLFTSKNSTEI